MTELELRKQALLLESQLNRLELRGELGRLREAVSWAGCVREARRRLGPWVWQVAPVAVAALVRWLRGRSSGSSFWTSAFELGLGLIRLWRAWPPTPKAEE